MIVFNYTLVMCLLFWFGLLFKNVVNLSNSMCPLCSSPLNKPVIHKNIILTSLWSVFGTYHIPR